MIKPTRKLPRKAKKQFKKEMLAELYAALDACSSPHDHRRPRVKARFTPWVGWTVTIKD